MTPAEYNDTVNLVKERYSRFAVDFKQAEQIHLFEQEKDLNSGNYFFSFWEEQDYTRDNFKDILDEQQFRDFLNWQSENLKNHETFLIESDAGLFKQIAYHEELLEYYEKSFCGAYYAEKHLSLTSHDRFEKSKIDYLKREYKAFLDSEKIGHISTHYRNNKLFQPNTLQLTLLRHKIHYVVPRFSYFKTQMDRPTRAVAEHLLEKFYYVPEKYKEFFEHQERSLSEFLENALKMYYDKPKGYFSVIKESQQQKRENQIMLAVLMDKDKYGC